MNWTTSNIYVDTLDSLAHGCSVVVNKGGTRSGKTWSILQALFYLATHQRNIIISVVGETMPFLKRGAVRDFRKMLGTLWNEANWNATDKIYTIPKTGSCVEFFSSDNEGKVHGSARDYLFINECYFVPWEIYRQLSVRTRRAIILDYNPRSRFWVDEYLLGKPGVSLIHSTYKDNPHLTAMQVAQIESHKGDSNWWRVYGMGETGSVEGLIYTNWDITATMPAVSKKMFYCVDFGFTNDPTAVLCVHLSGGELWVEELAYKTGMLNSDIVQCLQEHGVSRQAPIVCDSAEQKSIAEINNLGGYRAVPCVKGKGSIVAGISAVQAYKLHVMEDALGIIEELRNYSWKRDNAKGAYINQPIDAFNHALDALRYGVTTYLQAKRQVSTPRARIGHIC